LEHSLSFLAAIASAQLLLFYCALLFPSLQLILLLRLARRRDVTPPLLLLLLSSSSSCSFPSSSSACNINTRRIIFSNDAALSRRRRRQRRRRPTSFVDCVLFSDFQTSVVANKTATDVELLFIQQQSRDIHIIAITHNSTDIFKSLAMGSASVFWFLLVFAVAAQTVEGSIGCYRCSTRNGSDVNCEDPFHPAMSVYEKDCNDSKVGHIGKFPASFCLKIVGTVDYFSQEKLVIRTCTLENMENQCGSFKYDGISMTGCILTCMTDGCNSAGVFQLSYVTLGAVLLFSRYINRHLT